MSEEKKTSWGKAFDATAPREPQRAAAAPEGGGPAQPSSRLVHPDTDEGESSSPARARHQNVLPGILGKQLRAAYGELLNAPIPDSITDLIKQLERGEADKAASGQVRDEEESR